MCAQNTSTECQACDCQVTAAGAGANPDSSLEKLHDKLTVAVTSAPGLSQGETAPREQQRSKTLLLFVFLRLYSSLSG